MTHLYIKPLDAITLQPDSGDPASFIWRGRLILVRALHAHWRVRQEWWRREIERDYYRVEGHDDGVYEIYHQHDTGAWVLSRIYD